MKVPAKSRAAKHRRINNELSKLVSAEQPISKRTDTENSEPALPDASTSTSTVHDSINGFLHPVIDIDNHLSVDRELDRFDWNRDDTIPLNNDAMEDRCIPMTEEPSYNDEYVIQL